MYSSTFCPYPLHPSLKYTQQYYTFCELWSPFGGTAACPGGSLMEGNKWVRLTTHWPWISHIESPSTWIISLLIQLNTHKRHSLNFPSGFHRFHTLGKDFIFTNILVKLLFLLRTLGITNLRLKFWRWCQKVEFLYQNSVKVATFTCSV